MRLALKPQGLLERAALSFGFLPTPLVWASWGTLTSKCITVGTRIGVFDELARGEKNAEKVADATGCDAVAMEALLDALNGLGYVKHRDGRYSNSKAASKWLVSSSPTTLRDGILFIDDLGSVLNGMEEGVRTGKTADLHHGERPPEFWEHYMVGLANFAGLAGSEIVKRVRFRNAPRRLLDVAGGHGAYSVAFCRKYPGLEAEVLDLPEAAGVGRRLVAERGMDDRVCFRDGDLREVEWGENYDLILLFNIVHNVTVGEARQALAKAWDALAPGGMVLVLDSEYIERRGDISMTGGLNEILFFLTSGTRAYPERIIREWMDGAGFTNLVTRHLLTMPMAALIAGTKQ